jgi:isopropanol dehydrogenase (NADP+)
LTNRLQPPTSFRFDPDPLQIRLEPFGMGMSQKKILTHLCPGGRERMSRILRLMQTGKVDPTR